MAPRPLPQPAVQLSSTTTPARGDASFTINGGTAAGADGGHLNCYFVSANEASFIANGGTNGGLGGSIYLGLQFHGGRTKIQVFRNGSLDVSGHHTPGATIGSLMGDGLVHLGGLTFTVGGDNLDSTFSGTMQDGGSMGGTGGSFAKIGSGSLTLSGTNTYIGGTKVSAGTLVIDNTMGSGTGTGTVSVDAGTFGGKGIIAGAVTVGTGSGAGAFLETSAGVVKPSSLSIQSALTFKADSASTFNLNTNRAKADKVIANGVTINSGAQFNFVAAWNKALTVGERFVAISNTAATPISGTFNNLPDGSTFAVGPNLSGELQRRRRERSYADGHTVTI
jgi:autotransporter-associated beta strand protein